jgi:hypothetical protein
MAWEVSTENVGYLLCRTWDTLDDNEVVAMVMQAIKIMNQADLLQVLTDFREVTSMVTVNKLYELPELYDQVGVSRQMSMALLLPVTGHREEDYRFFENVCRNRGYNVRLFNDNEEAVRWLAETAG